MGTSVLEPDLEQQFCKAKTEEHSSGVVALDKIWHLVREIITRFCRVNEWICIDGIINKHLFLVNKWFTEYL